MPGFWEIMTVSFSIPNCAINIIITKLMVPIALVPHKPGCFKSNRLLVHCLASLSFSFAAAYLRILAKALHQWDEQHEGYA